MTTFAYKAKHGPEKTVEGTLEADSPAAALLALDRLGYSPIWVKPAAGAPAAGRRRRAWAGLPIRARDVTVFTRQLASLTRSGVPILRALRTILDQTENRRLREVVAGIEQRIRDGGMLSDALARYPALFATLYLDMVRAGESAGKLDVTLARLADAREAEEDLRRKVQAAMAYPLLVVAVGVATVFVLLTFFMPKIVVLFQDFAHLPWPTRLLIGASNLFARTWHWMVLLLVLALAIGRRLTAGARGRALLDAAVLRLPLFGRFVRHSDIARFARTLALLIDSGVPIDKALALSGNTLGNTLLREAVERARVGTVQKGAPLSEGLRQSPLLPAFVANMTAVGEEAGRLDETLREVATFYEKDVDQQARIVTSLIEPLLVLGVGAVVGFIVAAILMPIFELGTNLR